MRLISYGQRPGSKFGDQGDYHSGKRTEGAALNDSKLFQTAGNLSGLWGQLAYGAPGYGGVAHDLTKRLFQLPDTEKLGVIKNSGTKHAFYTPLNTFNRVTVEYTDKNSILGYPAGFLQCFVWIIDKLQSGKQAGIVKRIIVKGKVFGIAPVKVDPVSDVARRNIHPVRSPAAPFPEMQADTLRFRTRYQVPIRHAWVAAVSSSAGFQARRQLRRQLYFPAF